MSKVAIVILNYLNYEDTIECIDSIQAMQYSICGIVVVDNGSGNQSYKILKTKYQKHDKITVISSGSNLGFAKGNNIGMAYARKYLNADYVLAVNNDTIFTDQNYIDGLLNHHYKGVGVLGGKIILKYGEQRPLICAGGFKTMVYRFINMLSSRCGSCFDFTLDKNNSIEVLHGCALMFTPDFFKKYKGFYKKTFLYSEEEILYYMCKCKNLRQVYVPEVQIFHKEDMSSLMSFHNESSVINKYALQNEKYVVWWALKYYIMRLLKLCE